MKTVTATNARKHISALIDTVIETNEVVAIRRHNDIEALLIKFPRVYRNDISDTTHLAVQGGAFDFLQDEPDLYSVEDVKEYHV